MASLSHLSISPVPFLVAAMLLASDPAIAAVGDCGQPLSTGTSPNTSDALFVLRTSVELEECALCVCDVNESGDVTATDALLVLQLAVGLPVTANCVDCDDPSLQCPGVAQFALFAKIRGVCATNGDCAPFSTCDESIHRCRTVTDSDIGWNGLAHDADIDDPIPARLFVDCEGPAPCGECTITGHDPSLGDCRCVSDNQKVCFTVAGNDDQFCDGGFCQCYFGPPMPLSSGNTPVCVLNGLAAQPTGTGNVDTGSGFIHLQLSEKIFLGASLLSPCPLCLNDPTPADGVRGGVCEGGRNDTMGCDAQAYNSTFPPPTGGLYSLDCFPLAGADISQGGLPLTIDLTTGQTQLDAVVPCAVEGPLSEVNCPCRVCSGNDKIACHVDADCAAEDAGTCSSNGEGEQTEPNACLNGVCVDSGGNDSFCETGPDDTWCDAITRADGGGLVGCATNVDCTPLIIGVDAGTCTLVERRACFPDPIVSQGSPNPAIPIAAGTYCSPATTATSVNTAAGLPGPGRLTLQTALSLFCKGDPEAHYTPGVGGCPVE